MLAGMDKDLGMFRPELAGERGALDELGTCSDNRDDLHGYSVNGKLNTIHDSDTL